MKNIYTLTGITFLSYSRCVENKVKFMRRLINELKLMNDD